MTDSSAAEAARASRAAAFVLGAGFGLLGAVAVLPFLIVPLLGSGLGSALGAGPSSGTSVAVVAGLLTLLSVVSVVCGAVAARLGRRLGVLWAVLALLPTAVGAALLYAIATSPTFSWP